MSETNAFAAFIVSALVLSGASVADAQLGIGHVASATEISAENLTAFPDGGGLPPGKGTAKQGSGIYATQCAACHGSRGEGREDFPALAGGRGSLTSGKPILTVGSYWPYATTVWDYINRAMPYANPGSLRANEVYALTAYVLYLNGIVGEAEVLDRASLPRVRMPNRNGFETGGGSQ